VSSRLPRRWSSEVRSVTILGLISQYTIKGCYDQLLERAATVFTSGCEVDMLNSCWPTDVHNQRWLSIFREICICTINEHRAQMNWYFQCSLVSLNLCDRHLNMAAFKIHVHVLLLMKSSTFLYIERLPASWYVKVTNFKKWSGILPCTFTFRSCSSRPIA